MSADSKTPKLPTICAGNYWISECAGGCFIRHVGGSAITVSAEKMNEWLAKLWLETSPGLAEKTQWQKDCDKIESMF
jgi:hypothetical protein